MPYKALLNTAVRMNAYRDCARELETFVPVATQLGQDIFLDGTPLEDPDASIKTALAFFLALDDLITVLAHAIGAATPTPVQLQARQVIVYLQAELASRNS